MTVPCVAVPGLCRLSCRNLPPFMLEFAPFSSAKGGSDMPPYWPVKPARIAAVEEKEEHGGHPPYPRQGSAPLRPLFTAERLALVHVSRFTSPRFTFHVTRYSSARANSESEADSLGRGHRVPRGARPLELLRTHRLGQGR